MSGFSALGIVVLVFVLAVTVTAFGSLLPAIASIVGFVLVLPSWRQREGLRLIPVLVFLVAVFNLREVTGTVGAGLAATVLLPVLWVALHGSRRELALTVAAVAAFFLIPLVVIGGETYPASRWPVGVVVAAVAGMAGLLVRHLVGEVRAHATQRQDELLLLLQVFRDIARTDDVRAAVCEGARIVTRASTCVLLERADDGRMVSTASAGTPSPSLVSDPTVQAVFGRVVESGRGILLPGAEAGATFAGTFGNDGCVAIEPVVGTGINGALVVGWAQAVERHQEALELLAADAASAIAHADAVAEMHHLARVDPLTGLPNRRAWDETLISELARAGRENRPLSIALLDFDTFKEFNDVHGHQAGDRLLKEATAGWRRQLRDGDVLARWGGDEFAVLLAGSDHAQASQVVARLFDATPNLACSAGIAQWDGEETGEILLTRADADLYEHKSRSR